MDQCPTLRPLLVDVPSCIVTVWLSSDSLSLSLSSHKTRSLSLSLSLLSSPTLGTFQGDAVVKSEKARNSRRRSWAKFNLLSTSATRLGILHSHILAYLIPLSLLWHAFKSFVRFFFYYDASLISEEDYIVLYELLSSRIQILLMKAIVLTWMKWTTMNARPNLE